MRCLYCDQEIRKENLYSLLIKEDKLCPKCRKMMKFHHQRFEIDGIPVETFYEYDSLFRDMLLQYKECGDEALGSIFLYGLCDYLKFKYHGYNILYAPSTLSKKKQRGFDHLEEIFGELGLDKVEGLVMKKELSQYGKNKSERGQMCDNYRFIGNYAGKVLIADDIITTGSTVKGIVNSLPKMAKIKIIALASAKKY